MVEAPEAVGEVLVIDRGWLGSCGGKRGEHMVITYYFLCTVHWPFIKP